jgi:hypothetical protein
MCHKESPADTECFARFAKTLKGLPPDFLLNLMALENFMRLSLMKAAHADVGGGL